MCFHGFDSLVTRYCNGWYWLWLWLWPGVGFGVELVGILCVERFHVHAYGFQCGV